MCENFTDDHLIAILEGCPNLGQLKISNADITDTSVHTVLQTFPRINFTAFLCDGITFEARSEVRRKFECLLEKRYYCSLEDEIEDMSSLLENEDSGKDD